MSEWGLFAVLAIGAGIWLVIMGFIVLPLYVYISSWYYLGHVVAKHNVMQYFKQYKGNSIS